MRLEPGDVLTVAQARQLIPLSRSGFYRLLESGAFPGSFRVRSTGSRRGSWLIPREGLEGFVARGRAAALAELGAGGRDSVSGADDIVRGRRSN